MRVLALETSCDDTAAAVYDSERGLLAHCTHSQAKLHDRYGGVVPELASRDHLRKIRPLIEATLREAQTELTNITGIGYTAGPGLPGALFVGAAVARSLGWALKLPTLGVHHLEGHLLAPMLETDPPVFPFLVLLVSGGHTLLAEAHGIGRYRILGESLDDAAGEAFDKTAKLLGLPYPGGPHLAKLAQCGTAARFKFPRPMTNRPGLDFSFSGLKTHVRNAWLKSAQDEHSKADIARAFEDAVVETLLIKCRRALKHTGLSRLVVAGGVGANAQLRSRLRAEAGATVYYPRPTFCTDNAAMIAYAATCRLLAGERDDLTIRTRPRWPLTALTPVGATETER